MPAKRFADDIAQFRALPHNHQFRTWPIQSGPTITWTRSPANRPESLLGWAAGPGQHLILASTGRLAIGTAHRPDGDDMAAAGQGLVRIDRQIGADRPPARSGPPRARPRAQRRPAWPRSTGARIRQSSISWQTSLGAHCGRLLRPSTARQCIRLGIGGNQRPDNVSGWGYGVTSDRGRGRRSCTVVVDHK